MNYSYEGRVVWHDLSPPIQELLKGYQDQINDLSKYLDNKINNLITIINNSQDNLMALIEEEKQIRLTKDEELEDLINQLSSTNLGLEGAKGQVVRTNATGKPLYADDHFFILRATNTDDGVTTTQAKQPFTLEEVFNTWERESWYSGIASPYVSGGDDSAYAKTSWSYDSTKKSISNNGNWYSWGTFGSTKKYDNFEICMSWNGKNTGTPPYSIVSTYDDDYIGFIPAYLSPSQSPDGKLHVLCVIRFGAIDGVSTRTDNQAKNQFALVFDPDMPTQTLLAYVDAGAFNKVRWLGNQYTSLKVIRKGKNIKAWSSEPSSTRNSGYKTDPGTFIDWTLPASDPGYPTGVYNLLLKMLDSICQVGFFTMLNSSDFYLDDQKYLFDDPNIYDLEKGLVYEYDMENGVYKPAANMGEEEIPWRSFLYNPVTKELFWYKYPGDYTKIDLGGSSGSGSGSGGGSSSGSGSGGGSTSSGNHILIDHYIEKVGNSDKGGGYVWYNLYDDGWCEQGGWYNPDFVFDSNGNYTQHARSGFPFYLDQTGCHKQIATYYIEIWFPKPFKDTCYNIITSKNRSRYYQDSVLCGYELIRDDIQPDHCKMYCCIHYEYSWRAEGYVE